MGKDLDPASFPYTLPEDYGEINSACEECPGVYYVSASAPRGAYLLPREYYIVVENAAAISAPARAYGVKLNQEPTLYLYDLGNPTSGHYIVRYEIARYHVRQKDGDGGEDLLEISRYAAEYHPE